MGKNNNSSLGIVKVDARNRVTLPKSVLDLLNLEAGNHISYVKDGNGIRICKAYFGVMKNHCADVGGE